LNILANGTRRDGSYNFGQISNICTRILNPWIENVLVEQGNLFKYSEGIS
jgi:hypothetical protein